MDKVFLSVLNMSITGAFVIAAVVLARLPLKKAPKIISYCLWAVVGFRLICPFSIESALSLVPFESEPIQSQFAGMPYTITGYTDIRDGGLVDTNAPDYYDGPPDIAIVALGSYVWSFGAVTMLLYGIASYLLLKRRMRTAIRVEGNIYETDNIPSPFVLGIIKPKIYLPLSLADGEREYILLHEQTHINRCDHIVKFAAYFILCLHWFNPLAWAAFILMGVDMEMSCDERVLKELGDRSPAGGDTKHDYSRSLLSLATGRRVIGGSPLAFGESGVKGRIKNVLNFRKPSRVIIVAAVALVAVLSVGFAVNRASGAVDSSKWEVFEFPSYLYDRVTFQTDNEIYYHEYVNITAHLMNTEMDDLITCGSGFKVVKQINNEWRIVPMKVGFDLIAWELERGNSHTFTLTSDMLSVRLDDGHYRIVTDIFVGSATPISRTVWAEFAIDKNAPMPRKEPSPTDNPYKTRELSRDGDYKLMEMYVYDETVPPSKRITFELPVEWDFNSGSVFANGESGQYSLKIDMGSVISAARDEVLTEFNNRDEIADIFSESIYSTENHEVFQYKHTGIEGIGDGGTITTYYLYSGGERFSMCAYVFTEDKLEYDEIFKRIAESVRFQ